MWAGVSRAFSSRSARYSGLGRQILYISRTWSGISIHGSAETSCAMIACGKIGARSAGPIGCSVWGFRYGAGGAGMSGRMLYQRSGMSLSSRRIFLVTAQPPESVRKVPRPESVALPASLWTPALVASAGAAAADQLEPGPGAVGATRRRLPAPALKLHRPRQRDVLVGCRMKGPGRVVKVRSSQRDQVGTTGQDDAVHVVVSADRPHRDRGHAGNVSNPVRKRGLVAPPEARVLLRNRLTGGHVDRVDPMRREGARHLHRVVEAQPAFVPIDR